MDTPRADALYVVVRAANHLFAARCPEHWQGHEHLPQADKEAINILDYAARGIRRAIRYECQPGMRHAGWS